MAKLQFTGLYTPIRARMGHYKSGLIAIQISPKLRPLIYRLLSIKEINEKD
jgi:hypothetical protein